MNKSILLITALSGILFSCNNGNNTQTQVEVVPTGNTGLIQYQIMMQHPHDRTYFTEGLEFYNGHLLESSGGDDKHSPYPSGFGIVDTVSGKVDEKVSLDKSKHFGEGLTVFNDKIYFVTWRSQKGFVYDARSFKKIDEFNLPSKEGWGLTHDTSSIIMSDGSSALYYIDPETYQTKFTVNVYDHNGPVSNLNELEYVDGYVYANQWTTSYILKIDAREGKVAGKIDLSRLAKEVAAENPDALEMNGIAYHPGKQSFYVTGKLWHKMFEIKLQ